MKWRTIILLTAITMTAVICDLINRDNIWTSTSTFHREHGRALIGHVIKTLPMFIADCLAACQETLRCFSVNYVNFYNGSFFCELNWSSKKQSKDSYVKKDDYEYAEPQIFLHCDGNSCAQKEAQEGGWLKFNSSQFKIVNGKKTWSGAQAYCQSLGGNLASFQSHTEYRFVQETFFHYDFLMNPNLETFSLHGGAAIETKDSRKAIYFDGINDYAIFPSFDNHKTDFTIAFWFKVGSSSFGFVNLFNNKKNSVQQTTIFIYYSFMAFSFYNTNAELVVEQLRVEGSDFPIGQWYHMTVTWNRQAKRFKLYMNSVLKKSLVSTHSNVDLLDTGETFFEIGAEGGARWFKGWISDLVAIKQELKQTEVENLKDGLYFGAWIGLNDIDEEGIFKWSDNQPLTYMSAIQNQHSDKDCVYLRKGIGSTVDWSLESCNEVHPFICEKR